ncbi:Lipid A export ATP-binding/permease protein MsbA [Mariniflexile rhizosphaerae]|uniref:ABC transporter ATP-binding protein n=1 Tax=unclassified Mariniflexile TaxID=2643887 RepID=UPI000CBC5EFE|nr:ABC transporter ATP-binding protein [Mariniflexile sp. TRM1-10]AXP82060.1 Lipid A export ATP-binding/permease protein MsbA [Mariniflexile sp. TRM1-10]PLB20300.1 MAG: Lipid A export ATP-binding/permease protein MsbA [Flavobacteriaceae bacterium FS1-H7996/R]
MKNFKRFLKYLIPYKKFQILSIVFNILYALFSSISMLSLLPMVKVLFEEGEKLREKPVFNGFQDFDLNYLENYLNYSITTIQDTKGHLATLIMVVAFVLSTFLLKNVFNYLSILYMTYLNNGILKDLRQDVYDKVISLNVGFFSNERKGDLIARMTSDINTIKVSFMGVLMMVREPLTILFTLAGMFAISWKLTIFVLFFIPISGFLISKVSKNIKSQSGDIFALEGHLLSNIEETLGGIKIIKNFTSENYFSKKFKDFTENINTINNSIGKKMSLSAPASEFLGIFAISILLVYGGSLVLIEKSLSGGAFMAYMGLAYQILTPAKAITKANHALQGGNAAYERVAFILDAENPLKDKIDAKVISEFTKEIKFNNISFKYKDDYVLKDFSLTVPKGKTVALVGESGSGKSTLANLITRFYDVNEGNITFDGVDIKDVTTKSLREQMGIVAQDSILFNDTIANNISLGIEDANDEKIIAAAKVANAHNFISEFPHKYQNNVGDGGSLLSGGQRQRIAIARAVMKNPPIMILDEATSALDTESEKLVQNALENMMENRTSLVIAHRLSTIQNADLIVVMKKGRIVEQGSHEELLKMNGTYTNLVSLQSLEVN